jgi:hypothetical protein
MKRKVNVFEFGVQLVKENDSCVMTKDTWLQGDG